MHKTYSYQNRFKRNMKNYEKLWFEKYFFYTIKNTIKKMSLDYFSHISNFASSGASMFLLDSFYYGVNTQKSVYDAALFGASNVIA